MRCRARHFLAFGLFAVFALVAPAADDPQPPVVSNDYSAAIANLEAQLSMISAQLSNLATMLHDHQPEIEQQLRNLLSELVLVSFSVGEIDGKLPDLTAWQSYFREVSDILALLSSSLSSHSADLASILDRVSKLEQYVGIFDPFVRQWSSGQQIQLNQILQAIAALELNVLPYLGEFVTVAVFSNLIAEVIAEIGNISVALDGIGVKVLNYDDFNFYPFLESWYRNLFTNTVSYVAERPHVYVKPGIDIAATLQPSSFEDHVWDFGGSFYVFMPEAMKRLLDLTTYNNDFLARIAYALNRGDGGRGQSVSNSFDSASSQLGSQSNILANAFSSILRDPGLDDVFGELRAWGQFHDSLLQGSSPSGGDVTWAQFSIGNNHIEIVTSRDLMDTNSSWWQFSRLCCQVFYSTFLFFGVFFVGRLYVRGVRAVLATLNPLFDTKPTTMS